MSMARPRVVIIMRMVGEKMGHVVKGFGRVVPAVVLDARAEAAALLAKAQRQAASLVDAAAAQAEAIRAEARRVGESAGRAAGEEACATLVHAAHAEAERMRTTAAASVRVLAVRMAEKIIGRVVELDPSALTAIAGQALEAVRARAGVVVLRVHPDDLPALEPMRATLTARLAKAVELRLVGDATVGPTGCVVESAHGRLDARLATQLATLERAAFGESGQSENGPSEDRRRPDDRSQRDLGVGGDD
jgi:type III secretion protein L